MVDRFISVDLISSQTGKSMTEAIHVDHIVGIQPAVENTAIVTLSTGRAFRARNSYAELMEKIWKLAGEDSS